MGLGAGVHRIGQLEMEIKGKRAVLSGTDTLCGSIAIFDECVRHFMKTTGCSVVEAVECASLHPAQGLGLTDKIGTLDYGTNADFIMLDDEMNVLATHIAGACVWSKHSHS
ncbi:AMDHD2 (predicted) [Pycnogonum litorale]